MDDVISKIGRNFIVASFVPALAFASLSLFVFGPILPQAFADRLRNTLAPLDQPVLLLLMITVIIGFSLHSLNTTIYKVIEGYFLLNRFPAFSEFQKRRVRKTYAKIVILEQLHERLLNRNADAGLIANIKDQIYQLSANFQRNYPLTQDLIMPTRFGNAFRAMEAYPRLRYKMDAVLIWPRLIQEVPDKYYSKLDESNNSLAFLINCSILSLGTAIASGFATWYQFFLLRLAQLGRTELLYFIPIDTTLEGMVKYRQNAYLYLFGIIVMMVLFVFFYRAAIPIVVQYGELVKSAFDLFRWPLIKTLHLKPPVDYDSETTLWENLSLFIGHGLLNENVFLVPFRYSSGSGEDTASADEDLEDAPDEE